ncbi:MAG: DUF5916 domain-containing protein [Gemmatimonadales bacterium]
MIPVALLAATLQTAAQLAAAPTPRADSSAAAVAAVRAVRVGEPLSVDGRLDDPAWAGAEPVTRFTQRIPREGDPATERTEVRLLYDDDALYVGARLHDTAPDSVVALLARRDRIVSADRFTVFIDAYHDRRSGFYFGVNAAGTLYDGTLYNDDWNSDTWDGVWDARVTRDALGWTAEMRIPYSQIRFERREVHVWGVNYKREIARRNEQSYLVIQPNNASGFVSRFADLVGIERVSPPARLEVLPYITARAEYLDHNTGDPFNDGSRLGSNVGADFKLGIGSNLTLDATANPDFGQVEVDPAIVNLSDVETFFEERRPFFIEGGTIFTNFGFGGANDFWGFNWGGGDFLYSRRIGRAPQGSVPAADYSTTPSGANILGAAKLTGKIGSWNLGALNAVTSREHARMDVGGVRSRAEVEPLSWYGVTRVQKEFGRGRHGLGFIGTGAVRAFGDPRLRDEVNANAFVLGVDGWVTFDKAGVWVLSAWAGASRVGGAADRVADVQRSSVHYFQRPDASHITFDTTRTSLSGWAGRMLLNKQKGDWMLNASAGAFSPGFEMNDVGFQIWADHVNTHLMVGRRWTRPSRLFQRAQANIATFRNWTFGGDMTDAGYFVRAYLQFRNFYEWTGEVQYSPRSLNPRRSRGGPLSVNPHGVYWRSELISDVRKTWSFGLTFEGTDYALDRQSSILVEPSVEWRPTSKLTVRVAPSYENLTTTAHYVGSFDDPGATATFGRRYLFAGLNQNTLSASVRLNWIFTPRLSLELYAQPLLSSGEYAEYKELARPRTYEFGLTGPAVSIGDDQLAVSPATPGVAALKFADPNFSLASLRGNAILRWEYLPGSTLFLVWTQSRSDTVLDGQFRLGDGLDRLLSGAADNVFLVKLSYWWRP